MANAQFSLALLIRHAFLRGAGVTDGARIPNEINNRFADYDPPTAQYLTVSGSLAEPTLAARDVLAERRRQIDAEGWTPEHDDQWATGQLAEAAGSYALFAHDTAREIHHVPAWWPWAETWWKPTTTRRDLVKAGALILAEIERLDRKV